MNVLTTVAAVSSSVVIALVVLALKFWVRRESASLVRRARVDHPIPPAAKGADLVPTSPLSRSAPLAAAGAIAGVLAVATVMRFGVTWLLPAHLSFVALAVVLSAIDLAHQRLPDVFVLPAALLLVVMLAVADLADQVAAGWVRGVCAAAALFTFFLATALIAPAGIGMGDVKLAVTVGLYTGYISWRTTALGALLSFLAAAAAAICLLVLRRAHRGSMVPFGPSMLLGALAAVWITSP